MILKLWIAACPNFVVLKLPSLRYRHKYYHYTYISIHSSDIKPMGLL